MQHHVRLFTDLKTSFKRYFKLFFSFFLISLCKTPFLKVLIAAISDDLQFGFTFTWETSYQRVSIVSRIANTFSGSGETASSDPTSVPTRSTSFSNQHIGISYLNKYTCKL